jgi:uncharacterized membrane protein
MKTEDEHLTVTGKAQSDSEAASISDQIGQNIEKVVELQKREWERITPAQRRLERVSRFVARPLYLVALLWFVAIWIGLNVTASSLGFVAFDPPPFQWLDTLITFVALLTTTVVLISQNRQTKLEQQHAHLDLQVNLLTEQKVTKLIHLIEELRRDLPFVKDRHDQEAATMQQGADAAQMVSALHKGGLTREEDELKSKP